MCAGEACAGRGSVLGGAAPTFRMEDLHSSGLEEDFALIVAEGDQGWGKDSRPEDGEQGGALLFAVLHCHQCHLRPGAPLYSKKHIRPHQLTYQSWAQARPVLPLCCRRPLACL